MIAGLLPKAMNDWGEKIRKYLQTSNGLGIFEINSLEEDDS